MSDADDRVRNNTDEAINKMLDQKAAERVEHFRHKSSGEITRRIEELDREWDIERILEMNASALAFTGLVLGVTRNRKWLVLPGLVLPFLFQHAVQGWCPPLPLLRRLGVRSREEIDREKYSLKLLRGDFARIDGSSSSARAIQAARK